MDKNMIKIDDLLKQRLSNGEEKERPGAWLQMRELLDKEMPVTQAPAAAYNWRRMMGYLAGLALLATVSVGGYQVATRFNDNSSTQQTVAQAVNGRGSATVPTNNVNTSSNNNQTDADIAASNTAESTENTRQQSPEASTNNNQQNKQGNTLQNTSVANTTKATLGGNRETVQAQPQNTQSAGNVTGSASVAKTSGNKTQNLNSQSSYNNQKDNQLGGGNDKIASNEYLSNRNVAGDAPTAENNINTPNRNTQRSYGSGANVSKSLPVKTNLQKATVSAPATNTVQVNKMDNIGATNTSSSAEAGTSAASKTENTNNNNIVASANTKTENKQSQAPQQPVAEKILINKIETKEKYSRATGWKKDTISTGKVEWQKEAVLAKAEEKPADNTVVPAASMSLKANSEESNLVPLADYKVSGKNEHYEKVNHFAEMVQNAKMRMGTVRFYPGLIVGANTSLSSQNSLYGFQLGATGTLSLNDRWGIFTELKYVQRLRKDGRFDDNYKTGITEYTNTANQSITQFDSTEHYFNYTTVSSIDLPVAIKYSLKRLNLFGGGNLVYNFGVSNVEEVRRDYKDQEAVTATIKYEFVEGAPKITVEDFKSRFSVGYLIGAGYQLSPALQLDIRLTQNVWDNAKTQGAKLISKDLYKTPSLQINMSYRFSSSKNRPMKAR